jgi:hypothetical protein
LPRKPIENRASPLQLRLSRVFPSGRASRDHIQRLAEGRFAGHPKAELFDCDLPLALHEANLPLRSSSMEIRPRVLRRHGVRCFEPSFAE